MRIYVFNVIYYIVCLKCFRKDYIIQYNSILDPMYESVLIPLFDF